MKLTKLQRFTAYCIMRKEAEHKSIATAHGFFLMAEIIFGSSHYMDDLIELDNKKKRWVDLPNIAWKDRANILDECIAETSPDTTQSPNR